MISIVPFCQDPLERFGPAIETMINHFGDRIQLHEADSEVSYSLRDGSLVVLLLPSVPNEWKELIDPLIKSNHGKRFLAAVCSENERHISRLLETNIDDFILLPTESETLVAKIERLLQPRRVSELDELKPTSLARPGGLVPQGLHQFVGQSRVFLEAIDKVSSISRAHSPVLITGESGTGKELAARAIHYVGSRAGKHFIPINCSAIPENLFENELFGHEKGAFTDASSSQRGLIHMADGGTLFLDEVDSLNLQVQSKLLRFLEDGMVRPLGSSRYVEVNTRIICATNVDLLAEVEKGAFREDLYYRINVLSIELPPLRLRQGDIPIFANHFLEKFAAQSKRGAIYFSCDALEALSAYDWPGNVRELSNVIERAVIMSTASIIQPRDLLIDASRIKNAESDGGFNEAKTRAIENFEKQYVLKMLRDHQWNIRDAARSAKKDRRSFQRLMRKYGIDSAGLE
ncbi:MAG: sigma-54-dependent Fis family transcriptional regulator [Ignavibacteria bacterium]|nr:sigma-54-dependent Fis family transcriptional regulator [Ignavibacteria bacterium]